MDYLNNKILPNETEAKEEMASFLIELIPKNPFGRFLDYSEIYKHFISSVRALNKDKSRTYLFGISTLPQVGTKYYYLDKEGRVFCMKNRSTINKYSKSNSFLDLTVTNHSRFKNFV